jgi:AcrR family transcriptional regulator
MTVAPASPGLESFAVPDLTAPDMATRILGATTACIAEQGLRSTSIDDIAVASGCSRATVYRVFPGGRAGLLDAACRLEVDVVLDACTRAVAGESDLASAVAAAVCAAAVELRGHPALQRLLVEDPGAVLPFISFDGLAPILDRAASWGEVHLARFTDADHAAAVGEWGARVVLAHLRSPGSVTDTADPAAVRRLVDTHLLPAPRTSPSASRHPSRA